MSLVNLYEIPAAILGLAWKGTALVHETMKKTPNPLISACKSTLLGILFTEKTRHELVILSSQWLSDLS